MKKIVSMGLLVVVSTLVIISCGTGISGLKGFATAVGLTSSSAVVEYAYVPPKNPVLQKIAGVFGIGDLIAASASGNFDVPNLHWGPDCPICKVKPECAALDTFDTAKNILSVVPSAISGGKVAVGTKILLTVVSEGTNGLQPGKEDCYYTNQAITDNWTFTITNGCTEATVTDGPHDGEAVIEALTAGGTCTFTATGRDKLGTIGPIGPITFTTVAANTEPPISEITINGESINYLQPVKLNSFSETTMFGVSSTATLADGLTDWRASTGYFGNTGVNPFHWSAYDGAGAVTLLVTIQDNASGVLNQVKFLAVE